MSHLNFRLVPCGLDGPFFCVIFLFSSILGVIVFVLWGVTLMLLTTRGEQFIRVRVGERIMELPGHVNCQGSGPGQWILGGGGNSVERGPKPMETVC